jgi:hypothetical protein
MSTPLDHRVETGVADHLRHGPERADRCQPQDAGQDAEDQRLDKPHAAHQRLPGRAHRLNPESDQQRHEQGLQHVAHGE